MKKITVFLIISILLVIWIDFISLKLPSIFENPEKIENIISNLSLAYIASYMFYYLNNYLPERRNSKILKRIVNNNVIFIIQYRRSLNTLKDKEYDKDSEINVNGEKINIEDYLDKFHKSLHYNLDSMITIKERLLSEFLHYTLLLKKHPYFKSNFKDFNNINRYVESFDSLSSKLHLEFLKL